MTLPATVNTQAAAAHRTGNHELALSLYRDIAASPLAHPNVHYNIAVQLRALGRHAEALHHLGVFLRHDPANFKAWTNAGDSARELGRTQEALRLFAHALQLAPHTEKAVHNAAVAHHNLSRELIGACDMAAALHHAEEAARISPNDPDYVMGLGEVQLMTGDYEKGWENYEARFLRNFNDNTPEQKFAIVLRSWRGTATQIGELDMADYSA